MTIDQLYQSNNDFRSLIAVWVNERRCPMGLVDLLLECDQPNAADCAMWCATIADRPTVTSIGKRQVDMCGAFPAKCSTGKGWYWNGWKDVLMSYAHITTIEPAIEPDTRHYQRYPTPETALLWLLSNWISSEVLV